MNKAWFSLPAQKGKARECPKQSRGQSASVWRGTLVSGNMDQNLHNPSCKKMSHTHVQKRSFIRQTCRKWQKPHSRQRKTTHRPTPCASDHRSSNDTSRLAVSWISDVRSSDAYRVPCQKQTWQKPPRSSPRWSKYLLRIVGQVTFALQVPGGFLTLTCGANNGQCKLPAYVRAVPASRT